MHLKDFFQKSPFTFNKALICQIATDQGIDTTSGKSRGLVQVAIN
jgi:hypothetical protein